LIGSELLFAKRFLLNEPCCLLICNRWIFGNQSCSPGTPPSRLRSELQLGTGSSSVVLLSLALDLDSLERGDVRGVYYSQRNSLDENIGVGERVNTRRRSSCSFHRLLLLNYDQLIWLRLSRLLKFRRWLDYRLGSRLHLLTFSWLGLFLFFLLLCWLDICIILRLWLRGRLVHLRRCVKRLLPWWVLFINGWLHHDRHNNISLCLFRFFSSTGLGLLLVFSNGRGFLVHNWGLLLLNFFSSFVMNDSRLYNLSLGFRYLLFL